jgi:hypothetical protein
MANVDVQPRGRGLGKEKKGKIEGVKLGRKYSVKTP